ncbi:2-oxoacid:ferredoxin oxidoreductase subunit beta, partial [Candidatus Sumerlaeota bacterium]|nr:2-oxoacid:ferredoxin oxidoreductase subunit beta [Candidatus Sumerlaeota bacterium]
QLVPLIKAAIEHQGAALIDVVSPCVAFNNHEGSTKSYKYAKSHEEPLHELGFMAYFEEIKVDYDPGTSKMVTLHDGSKITLKKLDHEYDPTNKMEALKLLHREQAATEFFTGLIYYNGNHVPADQQLNMIDEPLATLPASRLRPSESVLAEVMERFK